MQFSKRLRQTDPDTARALMQILDQMNLLQGEMETLMTKQQKAMSDIETRVKALENG